jgi:hypothetical protein
MDKKTTKEMQRIAKGIRESLGDRYVVLCPTCKLIMHVCSNYPGNESGSYGPSISPDRSYYCSCKHTKY